MALLDALPLNPQLYAVVLTFVLASAVVYLFQKPKLPKNAPPLVSDAWPVLGSLQFFQERWDWFHRATLRSKTGNFSFFAGQWPVIALTGEQGRRTFFESKQLGFAEGYAALLGGSPSAQSEASVPEGAHGGDAAFSGYFNKRLVSLVRPARLAKNLPQILLDAKAAFDDLAREAVEKGQGTGRVDVFENVYSLIFKFTMRTVACNEIAESPKLLQKVMRLFEGLDETATAMAISFPWMPTPAKVKRFFVGAQMYKVFNDVVKAREKTGQRDDDPLQYLLDQGDQVVDILTFVIGALFAGQLNSGINTSYVLLHLALRHDWLTRVREEVHATAARYTPDPSLPLKEQLMHIPIEAWENDFPLTDLCLREAIRLHMVGTAFRQNTSGSDIPIGKEGGEVIPKDAYATFALGDVHYNPAIYSDHDTWDPSRFEPEREEDKRQMYGYVGWGVARHPCLGMRFAKVENNIIVAFFMAYFENFSIETKEGEKTNALPPQDRNGSSAHKPSQRVFLKYDLRDQAASA